MGFPSSTRRPPSVNSYAYPDWLTLARFEVLATATVSGDGARVEMAPGQGVRHLTWLAPRPAS